MHDQIESIFRAIEYIEINLQNEVSIAQVAESAGYSLFHFIRTFNRIVHLTPYDYLIRRRLSEAARTLSTSHRRITDISQDFCFDNQETFSRAFRRMFDMQPSQWREKKLEVNTLLIPPKTIADLQFMNREHFQYPVIEELHEITVYGLMTMLDGECQTQQSQRHSCFIDLCEISTPHIASQLIALTSYIDPNWKKAYFFIGFEESDQLPVSPILVKQKLPAGRYVKICVDREERRFALNYLYFTWFPKSRFKPAWPIEIEFLSDSKFLSSDETVYIPVDFT